MYIIICKNADVVELVDTTVSKAVAERRGGSSPPVGTTCFAHWSKHTKIKRPLSPIGRGNVLKKRTGMDSNSIGVTKLRNRLFLNIYSRGISHIAIFYC